jgi:hypothetical protein
MFHFSVTTSDQFEQVMTMAAPESSATVTPVGTIRRSCLSHSNISQTSHMAVAIRSLAASPPPQCNGYDLYGLHGGRRTPEAPYVVSSTMELRVSAQVHGVGGLPLCSSPILTRCQELLPTSSSSAGTQQHLAVSEATHMCHFQDVLHLPVRYKDLSRDACIAFTVKGPSGRVIWGTTLELFDETGRLRTGLQKLRLYPGMEADGGMNYASKGATPGIEEEKEDSDPKWKASLVLHALERSEKNPQAHDDVPSVPWLDKFTKQRCHQILETSSLSNSEVRQNDYLIFVRREFLPWCIILDCDVFLICNYCFVGR